MPAQYSPPAGSVEPRRAWRVFSVLLLSSIALVPAAHARADRWAELDRASAELRVGLPAAARTRLARLHVPAADNDARLVQRLLRARAALALARAATARDLCLPLLEGRLGPHLTVATARILLDAALALHDASAIDRAADAILARSEAPAALQARARLSKARLGLHDPRRRAGAAAALKALAQSSAPRALRPRALEALAFEGPTAGRAQALETLLVDFPASAAARRAASRAPAPALGPEARWRRGQALFEAREYLLAEPDLQAARAVPQHAQRAALLLAIVRMRLRSDYPRAVTLLEEVRRGSDPALRAEAAFRLGVALGHLGRFEEARAAMRTYLKESPRGPFATEAGYQVGRLLHEEGRFVEAAAAIEAFVQSRPRDPDKYRWFVGWAWFRARRFTEARAVFASLAPDTNTLVGPKALYWTARAWMEEGRVAEARQALRDLARRAPLTYYGFLGHLLSAKIDHRSPLPFPRPAGWPLEVALAAPDLRPLEGRRLSLGVRRVLRLVRILSTLGFLDQARALSAEHKLPRTLRMGLRDPGAADLLLARLERYGALWRRRARRRLPWREGAAQAPLAVLEQTYPVAHPGLLAAVAPVHDLSPWWLLSHMLQESRYKLRARSHAGALGPMQVLPRTGRRIAKALGVPGPSLSDDQLFEPGIALRHAAWYLQALRREYGGSVLLAAAGYNAGPRLLNQHLARHRDLQGDVLIEEIGAHEARNYARKIADHIVRYTALYASEAERAALLEALIPPERAPTPLGRLHF